MEVRKIVSGEVESIESSVSVVEAASRMSESSVGALVVIDNGDMVGILTERDLIPVIAQGRDPAKERVSDWMTPAPDMLQADTSVKDAANWMLAAGYRHLPVEDDGRLVGMASIKDILWALTEEPV